jgi:cytochrome d ubiquinol oxidase subunit II
VSLSDVVAVLLFVGVVAYALFGGADFGSGVWDLLAGGDESGGALRAQIDRSIGPVWEANHVWLIYILVFMWTAFPTAFSALMTTLFVPWLLAGLGIVFRGAAFAFRKFSATLGEARLYGILFASSSLITPFFLGMIAGAIASGRVPADGYGDLWTSWTGPTSWLGGTLAVLACAFLAGTFLAADFARSGHDDLAATMGRRAFVAGAITGAVALAAVVAVAAVVVGWGVGQYPDLLVDEITIADAAGARSTLIGLIIVFGLASVTAVPALLWLFWLVNQSEWASDRAPAADS